VSAVWAVAKAAVRRRKLQTVVIGLVIMLSGTTLVFALGLLAAANAPFDDAFAAARGAHATAAFDATKVGDAQLRATANAQGVTATAGPFRTAVLPEMNATDGMGGFNEGTLVAGRADPGGPVDRLSMVAGRWARAPGELVINGGTGDTMLIGKRLKPSTPGLPELTVVGVASSATKTAGGWVVPGQIAALHGQGSQMLYRFADAGSSARITRDLGRATAGLPAGAMTGSASYLIAKRDFQQGFDQILPFVTIFGALGAVISMMIIVNVVSGAVVSGFRHIGVMKAIGFTPRQVTAVYVTMIGVPAAVGCLLGLVAGNLLAAVLVRSVKQDFSLPSSGGVSIPLNLLAVAGIVGVVGLTAFLPARRAGGLSAVRAISPVAASRGGRGRGIQRWLARTALPSPVSLGLSLPFARPGRTALTLAAIGLGALAATFGLGLHDSVAKIAESSGRPSTMVFLPPPDTQSPIPGAVSLSAVRAEALLRSIPGTSNVVANDFRSVHVSGVATAVDIDIYRGRYTGMDKALGTGRWYRGPGEIVVSEGFLRTRQHKLGDPLLLEYGGRSTTVRIVGTLFNPSDHRFVADWSTVAPIIPDLTPRAYVLTTGPGVRTAAYISAAREAVAGTTLDVSPASSGGGEVIFDTLFFTCMLILCVSAALGVLNTVVLNTRERARDLGILKSIGMTPRQVVAMVLTSMTALGVVGGLVGVPLGVLVHHEVLTYTGDLIEAGMPRRFVTVYGPALLAVLLVTGPLIGLLGALLPSSWAARLKTAAALRSE
jgi:putative ABC transport system permease protein